MPGMKNTRVRQIAEAMLERYARVTPGALDGITSKQCCGFCKTRGLKPIVEPNGSPEVDGAFIVDGSVAVHQAFAESGEVGTPVSTNTAA
jgi:hypothetical protein